MNFYRDLGYLIFGSRLRRLSEYFLAEINQVYRDEGIDFDASWFPVFYLLSQHQPVSIQELAETMSVSHSAASQLVTGLKKRHLVEAAKDEADGRKQAVKLTLMGEELLKQLVPVWKAIEKAMDKAINSNPESAALLKVLTSTEQKLQEVPLSKQIKDQLSANHHYETV